jgi:hypothetical protein
MNHLHLHPVPTTLLNIIIPSARWSSEGTFSKMFRHKNFVYIFSVIHGYISNPSPSCIFYYLQNIEIHLSELTVWMTIVRDAAGYIKFFHSFARSF